MQKQKAILKITQLKMQRARAETRRRNVNRSVDLKGPKAQAKRTKVPQDRLNEFIEYWEGIWGVPEEHDPEDPHLQQ